MVQMLKHKETGELFVYTTQLASLAELELVVPDMEAAVVDEVLKARNEETILVVPAIEPKVEPAAEIDIPSFTAPAKAAVKTVAKAAVKSTAKK